MLKSKPRLDQPLDLEESDISDFYSASTSTGFLTPAPIVTELADSTLLAPRLVPTPTPSPLRQQHVFNALNSPSSPELSRIKRPTRALSRSYTLPRTFQLEERSARVANPDIDDLVVHNLVVAKLRRWILGIAIVDFDLDLGPVINGVYPPLILFEPESENIAFASFPDSPQFEEGSQMHSFRIRENPIPLPSEKRPGSQDGFIYGYAYFDQRKDESSRRGYRQRSVVVLTHHQYPALFYTIASILGPLFLVHSVTMLETAGQNISTWPDPTPGMTMELGFLGSVLQVDLPHTDNDQQLTIPPSPAAKYDPISSILASSSPSIPPPILLFEASLSHLWSLWECLVLCEPILIFGPSAAMTSQAVWWLRDLLRPIPLAGDIRPYFTMQDRDRSSLVDLKLPPRPGLLLGVTNPLFERSCIHWPHILSLGQRPQTNTSAKDSAFVAAGPAPGWRTRSHNRFISKDRVLLKQLEEVCRGIDGDKMDASLSLRHHFCSRTTALMVPLNRYLNTLIPAPAEVTKAHSAGNALRLKPFNSRHFFASLKMHGSPLPFRSTSKRTEFYEKWLKTPSFHLWLANQEAIVQGVLKDNTTQ